MRSTQVFVFGLTAATLLAAGCSNSSEAIKLPVQPTAVETTIAPTTAPPPPSTAPLTTSATTVIATTVAAPTTAPPTTLDTESQIRAAVDRIHRTFLTCGITPESCDFSGYAVAGSAADVRLRTYVQERLDNQLRVSSTTGDLLAEVKRISFSGRSAAVEVCQLDSRVIVDPRDPNRIDDDIVVNDQIGTRRETFTMKLVDHEWLLVSAVETSLDLGVLSCGG